MLKTKRTNSINLALAALVACAALLIAGLSATDTAAAQRPRYGRGRNGGGNDGALVAQARAITGDTFTVETSTPRGARVLARSRPRPEVLQAIDRGLGELFAVARRHGYSARLNYSDYTIFLARADRTRNRDGAYSPDIAVGAAQYAGSVYDQGGYVYAAGMVLSNEPCAFIIAEHEQDWQRVSNVARYEGEHLILFHNDRRLYQQTLDHSRGGSHPILQ